VFIEPGGFITTGPDLSREDSPGKKGRRNGRQEAEGEEPEAGSEAGQGEGRRASSGSSTRSPAQTVGSRVADALKLEELSEWYPETRVLRSSSSNTLLTIRVGVFRALPYRAYLHLEIPHDGPFWQTTRTSAAFRGDNYTFVPDVRSWAMWDFGVAPQADHMYPDGSLCAFMEGEWIWGVDPIHVYLDWCVCWLGRVLHDSLLGRWPGRQHCSANARARRNKPDEFCGCGGTERWRHCHMESDLARSPLERFLEEQNARDEYLKELQRRGWLSTPPWT